MADTRESGLTRRRDVPEHEVDRTGAGAPPLNEPNSDDDGAPKAAEDERANRAEDMADRAPPSASEESTGGLIVEIESVTEGVGPAEPGTFSHGPDT